MNQARPLPPGAERRRQLKRDRRRERLVHGWRILVLLAMAGGLGYGLLRQGWALDGPEQVEVIGSRQVSIDQVIRAARITFPQPLLVLEPHRIAADLEGTLPVDQVQVTRLMAPPRLRVEMVDREPVARAVRRGAKGTEQGYVDRLGNWMSARQGKGLNRSGSDRLVVLGWQASHRSALRQMLEFSPSLLDNIRQIRFEPGGGLWLESTRLGTVRLGHSNNRLQRQLQVMEHLSETLPAQLQERKLELIDLTDPDQPELVQKPPKPVNKTSE